MIVGQRCITAHYLCVCLYVLLYVCLYGCDRCCEVACISTYMSVCLYVCDGCCEVACTSTCMSDCLSVCMSVTGAARSPTAPTVTVLSDSEVLVRWTAIATPHVGGLDVMFYKVQYRRVGGRRRSREWETVDDDIPSSKHAIKVNRLRPGQLQLQCSINQSIRDV